MLLACRLVLPVVVILGIAGCSAPDPGAAGGAGGSTSAAVPEEVAGCESFAADGATSPGDGGLPALRLPCLVGGPDIALDDMGIRPVLVNLWASWCGPCREEMPLLQQAYERYGDQVGFLGVDTEDTRSAAVSFLADFGITYAHVVDVDKQLLTELGAPGLPVTLAVAADGRIVDRQIGQVSAARLEELVAGLAASAGTS